MSPVFHQIITHWGTGKPVIHWGIGIVVFLGFGAVTYGGKLPDRFVLNPLFNGHALMHIGVNGALFCEWQFIRAAYDEHMLSLASTVAA